MVTERISHPSDQVMKGGETMIATPEKHAVISGIGISRIGRKTGISGLELSVESTRAALADAGLTVDDLDGIATFGDTPMRQVREALGMKKPDYRGGGFDTAGLLSPITGAAVTVGTGNVRHVLVYRTVQMMGGSFDAGTAEVEDEGPSMEATMANVMGDLSPLLANHAYSAVNWLALHCQRHMHLYGTTKEQLGWLAVNSRRNAAMNPLAALQTPMTHDDYMAARIISSPLGLFDCDIPVDGSIAVIISHEDYAKDCPQPAIRFEALGGSTSTDGWIDRPDYPKMASTDAANEMWSRTDLTVADLDIAELYDGFTYLTIAWLEALGICGEGEGGPYVDKATRIALDGELPLNTYGGQLSAGRMHGYWVLHEACLQLRGQAGERQVAGNPEVAVVAAGGGPIAGSMLLTR
jgi:acetyl-CoA acetyltransferase